MDILKTAWGDLLNENEKLAALLDKKDARIERLEAANTSLSEREVKLLAMIERLEAERDEWKSSHQALEVYYVDGQARIERLEADFERHVRQIIQAHAEIEQLRGLLKEYEEHAAPYWRAEIELLRAIGTSLIAAMDDMHANGIGDAIIAGIGADDTALEQMAAILKNLNAAGYVIVPRAALAGTEG